MKNLGRRWSWAITLLLAIALAAVGLASGCSPEGNQRQAEGGEDEQVGQVISELLNELELDGDINSSPAVTRWGSRLDVFARRDSATGLWHTYCLGSCSVKSNWANWENSPGKPAGKTIDSAPAAVAWSTSRIDVFARCGNEIWHTPFINGQGWLAWENLGPDVVSAPAVSSWGVNRLDLYAKGSNGELWHRACTTSNCYNADGGNEWQAWEASAGQPPGGMTSDDPAAVSWGTNRIDLLVRGNDSHLWHNTWTGSTYTGWADRGGSISKGVGVASWGVDRLDIFARGSDTFLWKQTWTAAGWRGWESLGLPLENAPDAISTGVGQVHVFSRSPTNKLQQIFCNGDDDCNAPPAPQVAGTSPVRIAEPFRLDVFQNTGVAVQQLRCNGSTCDDSNYQQIDLGGSSANGVAVTKWGDRLDAFVRRSDGVILHSTCSGMCKQASAWSAWESGPGEPPGASNSLHGTPAAVAWNDGRIDLFARGTENGGPANVLWHRAYRENQGGWSAWHSLGADIASDPGVASKWAGHLDVYAVGGDRRLWRRECTNKTCLATADFGAWNPDAGKPPGATLSTFAPGPTGTSRTQVEVYVPDTSGNLWMYTCPPGQTCGAAAQWTNKGRPPGLTISSGVAAARTFSFGSGTEVFTRTNDGNLWRWNTNWQQVLSAGNAAPGQFTPAIVGYVGYPGENSAAAIAPGHAHCPAGRAFIAMGTALPNGAGTIVQADLNCLGDPNCADYVVPPDPGDLAIEGGSNDNQIFADNSGNLYYARQFFIDDPNMPDNVSPAGMNTRVVEQLWRSTDCGNTWTVRGRVDPGAGCNWASYPSGCTIHSGQYALPQCEAAGGFDRPEFYADPWDGTLYATMNGRGGTLVAPLFPCVVRSGYVTVRSLDGGLTWNVINVNQTAVPTNITSTSNALFFFSCEDGNPGERVARLRWSYDKGAATFTVDGSADLATDCRALLDVGGGVGDGSADVSRVGHFPPNKDVVRITYPVLLPGNSQQHVRRRDVTVFENGTHTQGPLVTLGTAKSSTRMMVTAEPTGGTSTAIHYWRDVTSLKGTNPPLVAIRTQFQATRDAENYSAALPLAPTDVVAANNYVNSTGWWGHYALGAYYGSSSNPARFLAHWTDLDAQGRPVVVARNITVSQSNDCMAASLNGDGSFCSAQCPCDEGGGDCDDHTNDTDCKPGLVCAVDNGPNFGFSSATDVCVRPACETNPLGPGHGDFCRDCPCAAKFGDCDDENTGDQCLPGLVCVADVGAAFGWSPLADVCLPPHCADGAMNEGETGIDTGGPCGP